LIKTNDKIYAQSKMIKHLKKDKAAKENGCVIGMSLDFQVAN
jgi:hypothetical protein